MNYFTSYYAKAITYTCPLLQDSQLIGVPLLSAFLKLKANNMTIKMRFRNITSFNNAVYYLIPIFLTISSFQLSVLLKLNNIN